MLGSIVLITSLLLPTGWAWQEAQRQVARRYPRHAVLVYGMRPSSLEFRKGIFYDEVIKKDVYGSCVVGRSPQILVGLVEDPESNLDTLVHEYKHSILFGLPLSHRDLARAAAWVDGRANAGTAQFTTRAGRTRPHSH